MKHYFEAVMVERYGRFSVLDTFVVTKRRDADAAYDAAEKLCDLVRSMPQAPAAFVRERNGEVTRQIAKGER